MQDRIEGYLAFVCLFFDYLYHGLTVHAATGWFVTITWFTLEVVVTNDRTSAPTMGTELLMAIDSGINHLGSWHLLQLYLSFERPGFSPILETIHEFTHHTGLNHLLHRSCKLRLNGTAIFDQALIAFFTATEIRKYPTLTPRHALSPAAPTPHSALHERTIFASNSQPSFVI